MTNEKIKAALEAVRKYYDADGAEILDIALVDQALALIEAQNNEIGSGLCPSDKPCLNKQDDAPSGHRDHLIEAQTSAGDCPHCQGKGGHTESMCGEGCCLGGVECEYCNGTGKAASQQTRGEVEDHENRWCYGIQHAIEARDRQVMVDRLVELCETQAGHRASPTPPVAGKEMDNA